MSSAGVAGAGTGCWRSTTDSKSGRIYYYNTKTKETTWTKPVELATPAEREEMARKKEETRRFFAEMEHNIKDRIHRALSEKDLHPHHNHPPNGTPQVSPWRLSPRGSPPSDQDTRMVVDDDDDGRDSSNSGGGGGGGPHEYKYTASIHRSGSASSHGSSSSGGLFSQLQGHHSGSAQGLARRGSAASASSSTIDIDGPHGANYRIRTISSLDDDIFDFIHKKQAAAAAAAAAALDAPDDGRGGAHGPVDAKASGSPSALLHGARETLDHLQEGGEKPWREYAPHGVDDYVLGASLHGVDATAQEIRRDVTPRRFGAKDEDSPPTHARTYAHVQRAAAPSSSFAGRGVEPQSHAAGVSPLLRSHSIHVIPVGGRSSSSSSSSSSSVINPAGSHRSESKSAPLDAPGPDVPASGGTRARVVTNSPPRHIKKRRNSTGTLYVDHTMSTQVGGCVGHAHNPSCLNVSCPASPPCPAAW